MLTESQAIDIYKCKLYLQAQCSKSCSADIQRRLLRGKCGPVSKKFGVSPRIVRDIWNRHTWGHATAYLWEQEQIGERSISERERLPQWFIADTVDEAKRCHDNMAQGISQIFDTSASSNTGIVRIESIIQQLQTVFGTNDPQNSRCQLSFRDSMVDISIAALICSPES